MDAGHRLELDNARMARALAGSRDGHWERDLPGDRVWYSDSFWRLIGFEPGEFPPDRDQVNARIHPDDVPAFFAAYQRAIEELGQFDYEIRYLVKSGQWRWLRGRGRAWPGPDGRCAHVTGAVSDVHDEKTALLELQTMRSRLERAFAAANEGLIERIIGEDEVYLSPRVYELLGWPPGGFPAMRQEMRARSHPDDIPRYDAELNEAARLGRRVTSHFRLRHRDGSWRWFRQHCRFERLPDGRQRVTGVLADITDARLAQEELHAHRERLEALVTERTASLAGALALAEQRRGEAERAAAARSQFLAHMSHEIRTPLNGMLGLNELALRAADQPQQRRWLALAEQSGQTLLRLINDVLDYSRIEAGRLALNLQPTDLPETLALTLRSLTPLTRNSELMVLYDWQGTPQRLLADEPRLVQILTNLLGNAVKFTERGHIALVGRAVAADDGHADVTISVEDTGPGIAPDRREAVFQAFVQGDARSPSGSLGGTGLGLSIARTLAETMGGSLRLDDRPGGGTVFTLALRLAVAPGAQPPQPRGQGRCWLLHGNPVAGPWVEHRLAATGLTVRNHDSLTEAIAAVRGGEAAPELLVVAAPLLVPGVDLAGLRAAMPATRIGLLVRPDWDDTALESEAERLGMRCWPSPFSVADLVQLVDGTTPARASAPAALTAPSGRVLLVEDNPVNQLIGQEFLRSLGLAVQCVDDGQAAIDACLAEAPALVLMDVQMPVMDGLQATRRLRELQAQGRLPAFPVAGLTAFAGAADRAACLAAGMDDCLTKPLALAHLRQALAMLLPGSARPPGG